ncbi:hypothetical protein [Kitasatospora sp. NBC_01266]|uniref:hypothetical protein n=1 Tax=Kitasatospora sp. NBC_01266 TaxID=2903572 RepID=UPI002E3315A3|nr:hypothetical protein [Kitasatospora sp. NBC_01266]
MISIVARAAGVEEHQPLLLVGFAESEDGGGRAFHFQCDLRRNDYEEGSNWPEGESYCVSNEGGFTRFGCVSEIESKGNTIRVVFTEGAVRDLRLGDSEYEFQIVSKDVEMAEILGELRRILTCGRPEYHPRFLGM